MNLFWSTRLNEPFNVSEEKWGWYSEKPSPAQHGEWHLGPWPPHPFLGVSAQWPASFNHHPARGVGTVRSGNHLQGNTPPASNDLPLTHCSFFNPIMFAWHRHLYLTTRVCFVVRKMRGITVRLNVFLPSFCRLTSSIPPNTTCVSNSSLKIKCNFTFPNQRRTCATWYVTTCLIVTRLCPFFSAKLLSL